MESEYEMRKRAVFDGMSQRGQQRILRMGYENWDPFQEPKDPRDQIRNPTVIRAGAALQEFLKTHPQYREANTFHREVVELCRSFLRGEQRARMIFDFCNWYQKIEQNSE